MLKNNKINAYQSQSKLLLVVITLLLNTNSVIAKEPVDIPAIDCMMEPNVLVELSSSVAGVVDTLTVDKSDQVKKGQVLATLKSDIEQVSVKSSREKLKLSAAEYKRAAELYREKAITKSEKEQLDNDKKLAELELKHAKTSLDLRKIKSPIDGIVVKRYANPGEFVETKPILQLAQLNPLRIEVVSPVENYGNIVKGMQARIVPEFGTYDDLIANVVVVDKVIDAASGTFSVRLELENKDYAIPGGLKCSAKFMPANSVKMAKANNKIKLVNKSIKNPVQKPVSQPVVKSAALTKETVANDGVNKSNVNKVPSKDINNSKLCTSIGPYKKQKTVKYLLAKLKNKNIKSVPKTQYTGFGKKTYLIESNSFSSLAEREQVKNEIEKAGFTDIAGSGKAGEIRLAFGLFSSEISAKKRMSALKAKGFDVKIRVRQRKMKTYWADIIHPSTVTAEIAKRIPNDHRRACKEWLAKD